MYPSDFNARSKECTLPIKRRLDHLRWEVMYENAEHIAEVKADRKRIKTDEEFLFDDRAVLKGHTEFVDGEPRPLPINKRNADNIRRQLCALSATEHGHASQKPFDLCNRLFSKPTYSRDFTKQRKWQEERRAYFAKQKQQLDPHEACLNAKDYEGCIKVKSGASTSRTKKEQDSCVGDFCTVTTRGVDIFGLPKPIGWHYSYGDESIFYWLMPGRIPHKGQETRYLGMPRITRLYQNPEAGTSGSFIGGNTAANCTNIGSSINCTTTGSPGYISGKSATPGGVKSVKFTDVYDCQDNSYASYKDGKVWGRWREFKEGEVTQYIGLLKHECEQGDQYIQQEMKVLNLKL